MTDCGNRNCEPDCPECREARYAKQELGTQVLWANPAEREEARRVLRTWLHSWQEAAGSKEQGS